MNNKLSFRLLEMEKNIETCCMSSHSFQSTQLFSSIIDCDFFLEVINLNQIFFFIKKVYLKSIVCCALMKMLNFVQT